MPRISFTSPTNDFSIQQQSIDRNRQLAQALLQQGFQPSPVNEMAGQYVVKRSPLEGLVKIGQTALGLYGQQESDRKSQDLAGERQQKLADALKNYQAYSTGTSAEQIFRDDQGVGDNYIKPGTMPNRQAALNELLGSGLPELQQAGLQQMLARPEPVFNKIDPKDYTQESVARFAQTQNYADLAPLRKREIVSAGGTSIAIDPYAVQPGQTIQHTLTPGENANLKFRAFEFDNLSANQKANLLNEAKRIGISQQQLQEGRVQLVQDAEGNVALVNKTTGLGSPVLNQETGRPLMMPKPLTEGQGRAGLFGTRASAADKILRGLEENISTTGLAVKRAAEDIPFVGGAASALGNVLLSPDQQKVEQGQRDFINAVLRQESGAVISPSEFSNAQKQYFPQPGDSKQVIEQKRRNRETAIAGLKLMAGPAGKNIDTGQSKMLGSLQKNEDGSFNYIIK